MKKNVTYIGYGPEKREIAFRDENKICTSIRINENGSIRMIYSGSVEELNNLAEYYDPEEYGELTKEQVLANGYDDGNTYLKSINYIYDDDYSNSNSTPKTPERADFNSLKHPDIFSKYEFS